MDFEFAFYSFYFNTFFSLNLYELTHFTLANLPNLRRYEIVVFVLKVWITFVANSGLPHKYDSLCKL